MSFVLDFKFLFDTIKQQNICSSAFKEHIAIHDDAQRGFHISLPRKENVEQIMLNQKSEIMIDLIDVISSSSEVHFIDSSYSVMIWCLQHTYKMFTDIPMFLHNSRRPGRMIEIYTHNLPSNWRVV
jgi:hypothetical protein